ncbi:MAG TPA: hydroxysqualene dehydroxylase HpnE [Acidimicrobiales bacterium]|nr:hydroxysqualene dehydroxylase HpnE [Acidimicrobiales bacterium]
MIAVVGGGLAGITAALDLAGAGRQVVLLEGRNRLGGATWSFRRKGLWFDNGQHVFLRCCTEYRRLLDRIGAGGLVRVQDRLDVPVLAPGGPAGRLRRRSWPAPLHLGPSLARYPHIGPVDRLRLGRAALPLARLDLDDPTLDEVTFADWLRARGQSDRAIATLWDLITLPTVNLHADEASLALAAKVFQTGLLTRSDAADIGWSQVPLGALHGEPAAAALAASGVDVRLGARVTAVRPVAGGLAVEAGGHGLLCEAVVLAVPHQAAAWLLPPESRPDPAELPRLGASPIVNVAVVLDRRVTDLEMVAVVDSPLQWVFDRTQQSGLERGQCLAVSLSGADRWLGRRPEELVAVMTSALAEVFPAVVDAAVVDAVVTRERTATFRGGPGSRSLRPGPVTSVPGLYLAGAWADTGWPATMEGAVRSGAAAARALLDRQAVAAAVPPGPPSPPEPSGAHRTQEAVA